MRYDADGRKALDLVQARAARKLAEIHQMLAPGLTPPFGEAEFRRAANDHLAELPPAEQDKMRSKAIVAYSQLERLMTEMSEHLAAVGEELRKVNRQSRAVNAYSQTTQMARHNPAAV